MKIILVEDDYLQSQLIISEIHKHLSPNKIDIHLFETESDFRKQLVSIETILPDIILLDIMLRWTDPSANVEEFPNDVKEEGFYTAGFRCQKIISNNKILQNIPIILYTVLDKTDLKEKLEDTPKTVKLLTKDISVLIDHLKAILLKQKD